MQSVKEILAHPNLVVNMLFAPGKNLFQITAEIKDDSHQALGTVLESLQALAKVIRIEVDHVESQGIFRVTYYLEGINTGSSRSDYERILESSPVVSSYKVEGSYNGLLLNKLQFPIITSTGARGFLINQEVFNGIFNSIRQKFGSGGNVIIYDEGLAFGEKQARVLLSFFGREKAIEMIDELVKLYKSVGLGRPAGFKFDFPKSSATLKLYDSLECQGQKSAVPYSQFIRGHVCGLANVFFEKSMKCIETQCVASGAECCEFHVGSA